MPTPRALRLCSALVLFFSFAACTQKNSAQDAKLSPQEQQVARGARFFAMRCAMCHGEKGDGMGPMASSLSPRPANLIAGQFKYGDSPEAILKTVTNGVATSGMPSFGVFSEDDRKAVVAFVLSIRRVASSEAPVDASHK